MSFDNKNILPHSVREMRSNRKILFKTPRFTTAKVNESFTLKSVKLNF